MSLTRPMYLSRLRRAFLLRVHPDRFRSAKHTSSRRSKQANLVKALAERMSEADFGTWQRAGNISSTTASSFKDFSYVLERRDGSLLQASISLSDSVEAILASMAEALKQSGAASLPTPPVEQSKSPNGFTNSNTAPNAATSATGFSSSVNNSNNSVYNVVSNRGRDFEQFLAALDFKQIESRRDARTGAQAAALSARRLYEFQAVDATSLGWSSASVAMLLHQLTALHEEHSTKFHVDSFYPIRLLFTPDDFHEALDVYGGTLRLNPSDTSIQWLDSLQLVTTDKLQEMQSYRESVAAMTSRIQGCLEIKLKKGHSSSSREYFDFLANLSAAFPEAHKEAPDNAGEPSHSLVIEPIGATVEASQACRRPIVNKEGSIRLGAGMDPATVLHAVSRLTDATRKQRTQDKEDRQRCKEAVHQLQWQLGLHRVYRSGMVSHDHYLHCLSRILLLNEQHDNNAMVKRRLTGNSLGIVGAGNFCHLADDGSIVIPHDWR